ncbi:carboxylesterase [Cadophora sp. DSE1049]|nr:carboxylesterase [Cadophora sp. DSE1049]
MMSATLVLLSLGASLAEGQSLHPRQNSFTVPTVNTTSGLVSGHPAANATSVYEYLGIPYANPPTGNLRFAPPQPYTGNTSINGTQHGFTCPAIAGASQSAQGVITVTGANILTEIGQSDLPVGEDCLHLNIWVPSGGEENKAVLLWIFGGGFITGSADLVAYNGQYFAEQEDVIIIGVNYRLNIFGFPSTPTEPNSNLGLLDQRLAVEWTRDNIAAFGGDPSRITIFGQSAGSASVDQYGYAWTEDPIIAGMIQQSGSVNRQAPIPRAEGERSWFTVSNALGCGDAFSDPNEVVECMRSKEWNEILQQTPSFSQVLASNLAFRPVADNITGYTDYEARSRAGNFIQVPLLVGNTNNEADFFRAIDALSNATQPQVYYDNFNRDTFDCPSSVRANISLSQDVPTWRYRYFGAWPNMQLTANPDSGSWHTIDVLEIFDYTPQGPGIPAETTAQNATGRYMRGAWAAFAKNPKEGLASYGGGWPQYEPGEDTLIRVAYDNQTGTNLANPALYDAVCSSRYPIDKTASGGGTDSTPTGSGSSLGATSTPETTSSGSSLGGSLAFALLMAVVTAYLF